MAARRTIKKSEETLILPPITSDLIRPKRNVAKTLGNFGAYVLLPSLDPVQNMNAIYDVRKFCKILCESYKTWRIWQREVLLCSLSEKCSVNLLTLLSTILEPVFHRDFVSRLHGKFPNFKTKVIKVSKRGIINNESEIKDSDTKVGSEGCKVAEVNEKDEIKEKLDTANDVVQQPLSKINKKKRCDQKIEILIGNVEGNTESIVGENVEEIKSQNAISNCASPLTNLIKESLLKGANDFQNIATQIESAQNNSEYANQALISRGTYECESCHVHTANVYNQDTGLRFFSASRLKRLSDMKARSGLRTSACEMDQKCFKHRQWWSADAKEKRLVPARSLNLWKHFSRQLQDVNEVLYQINQLNYHQLMVILQN